MLRLSALILALFLLPPSQTRAETARIAVAGNFAAAAKEISQVFSDTTGRHVLFSFGSTGKLFAQISQKAPFDAFLSADQSRPARLVAQGWGVTGSVFTYAVGRLVLFSMDETLVDPEGSVLRSYQGARFAIANPRTAPYGTAAMEIMAKRGVLKHLQPKLVYGNTVAQTYQFIATGNAALGFVALSQVARHRAGSRWVVPDALALRQDAVLLQTGAGNPAATGFLAFLRSPPAHEIMRRYGYEEGS